MKLSNKEFSKLQANANKINQLRMMLNEAEGYHRDLLELIGDRYEVDLLGGTHIIGKDGELIEKENEE